MFASINTNDLKDAQETKHDFVSSYAIARRYTIKNNLDSYSFVIVPRYSKVVGKKYFIEKIIASSLKVFYSNIEWENKFFEDFFNKKPSKFKIVDGSIASDIIKVFF